MAKILAEIPQTPDTVVWGVFSDDQVNSFNHRRLTHVAGATYRLGRCYTVRVMVIGESHYMIVYDRKQSRRVFVELLACIDPTDRGMNPSVMVTMRDKRTFSISRGINDVPIPFDTKVRLGERRNSRKCPIPTATGFVPLGAPIRKEFPGTMAPMTIVWIGTCTDPLFFGGQKCLFVASLHEYAYEEDGTVEPLVHRTAVLLPHL